ncbi:hypothetical protein D3C72_816750 [compost metagenome]
MPLNITLDQCEKLPRQTDRLEAHTAVFEFRLLRQRIKVRQGQAVHTALEKTVAPVHRQKRLPRTYAVIAANRDDYRAATTFKVDQIARLQTMPAHFVRVQAQHRFADMPEQLRCRASAAHTVPLIAQAASDQRQWKASIALLFGGAIRIGNKLSPTVGRRKNTVLVQSWRSLPRSDREGPLLRSDLVDQRVADPGHIQIPSTRQPFEFIEQLRRLVKRKQARLSGTQTFLQTLCEIYRDLPVRPRLTRWEDGFTHVGNASLGIGHRAFFLAPTGGG